MELKKVQQLNFSQIIQKLNFCKTINNKQIKNKKNRAFIKGANFNFYKSTKVELLQKAQDAQSTQSMKFCTFKLRPVKFSISSSSKNLNYTKVCADFTAKNFWNIGPSLILLLKKKKQADPPDVSRIPVNDALGVTVVLLTCSYRGHEFVRVGYFINNEYTDLELRENPPAQPQFDKVQRNILGNKPRVTRFKINWDDGTSIANNVPQDDNMEAQVINEVESHDDQPTSSLGFSENTQNSMEVMWSQGIWRAYAQ